MIDARGLRSDPYAERGFFITPFSIHGQFEGKGWWDFSALSNKWVELCLELFSNLGGSFDHRWDQNLSHLKTRVTSAEDVGICTFFSRDRVSCSMLLLTGKNRLAERDAITMFKKSLLDALTDSASLLTADPFDFDRNIDRPLMIVVPFPSNASLGQDEDIVRELSSHLAAAFFIYDGHPA